MGSTVLFGGGLLFGGAVVVTVILLLAAERERNRRHQKRVEDRLGALESCAVGNHVTIQQCQGDVDILWGHTFPQEGEEVPKETLTEEAPTGRVEPWHVPIFVVRAAPLVDEGSFSPTYDTLSEAPTAAGSSTVGKPREDGWHGEHDGAAA